jgi:hypothetical protein
MAKKRYYKSSKGMFANMPQGSFMRPFPKNSYFATSSYPDKLADIDAQMRSDVKKAKSEGPGKKY